MSKVLVWLKSITCIEIVLKNDDDIDGLNFQNAAGDNNELAQDNVIEF